MSDSLSVEVPSVTACLFYHIVSRLSRGLRNFFPVFFAGFLSASPAALCAFFRDTLNCSG